VGFGKKKKENTRTDAALEQHSIQLFAYDCR